MQLENEVVGVRTHAQDHHAQDVNRLGMLAIDGGMACRTCGQEDAFISGLDVQLDREAVGKLRRGTSLRQHAGSRQLPLPLAPDDGIHPGLDDLARQGIERHLGRIARLHLMQFVLLIERDDLVVILDEGHGRRKGRAHNK